MISKLKAQSKEELFTQTTFTVLFLFCIICPFLSFSTKIILSSEIIVLFLLVKGFIEKGFINSLQISVSTKKRIFFLVFITLFIIFGCLFLCWVYRLYGLIIRTYALVSIVLLTGIITSYFYFVVWDLKLVRSFGVLLFSVGMCFLILIPVGIVPDEGMHSFTAYRISNILLGISNEGNKEITMRESDGTYALVSDRNYYTDERYNNYLDQINNLEVNNELQSFELPFVEGCDYLYILPAIGIAIGRLLSLNVVQMYLLGRILNFLLYLFGTMYALEKMTTKKMMLSVVALLPMFVQQGISISYDVPINVMSFWIVALTVKLFCSEEKLSKADWVLLIVSCICMCFVKSHAYILIGLLPILTLLGNKIYKSKHTKKIVVSLIVLSLIATGVVFVVAKMLPTVNLNSDDYYSIMYLLQNPADIISIVFNTFNGFGAFHLDSFMGLYLGYLDFQMHPYVIYVFYLLLLITLVPENDTSVRLPAFMKIVFLMVSIITIVFVFGGMLLACSTVSSEMVVGMQGRYLLSAMLLLFLTIEPTFIQLNNSNNKVFSLFLFAECCSVTYLMVAI